MVCNWSVYYYTLRRFSGARAHTQRVSDRAQKLNVFPFVNLTLSTLSRSGQCFSC